MKIYISKYLLASVLLIECGQLVYSSQSITTQTLQEEETKKVSIIINNDQTGNKQVFPGRTNLLGKHYWKDENTYVIDLENLLRHYENDKREINCLFDIVVCKGYKLEIKQSEEQTDYMTEADITIQNYGTLSFEKCSIGENTKIDNKGYLEIKLPTSKDNIVLSMDCNIFNDGYLKISGYNKRLPKITSNSGCVDYSEYTDKLFFYNNKISFKNKIA